MQVKKIKKIKKITCIITLSSLNLVVFERNEILFGEKRVLAGAEELVYLTTTGHIVARVNPTNLEVGARVNFNGCRNYIITDVDTFSWGVTYTLRYKKATGALGKTKFASGYYRGA